MAPLSAELLGGPEGGRMRGDRNMNDGATLMGQDDQHEQQSIRDNRHDEESAATINGRDRRSEIGELQGAARNNCGVQVSATSILGGLTHEYRLERGA